MNCRFFVSVESSPLFLFMLASHGNFMLDALPRHCGALRTSRETFSFLLFFILSGAGFGWIKFMTLTTCHETHQEPKKTFLFYQTFLVNPSKLECPSRWAGANHFRRLQHLNVNWHSALFEIVSHFASCIWILFSCRRVSETSAPRMPHDRLWGEANLSFSETLERLLLVLVIA